MPAPTWTPDPDRADATAMAAFRRAAETRTALPMADTVALHAWSVTDPDGFWSLAWDELGVLGERGPVAYGPSVLPEARFFPDARLNLAENLLRPRDPDADPYLVATAETRGGVAVVASLSRAEVEARVAATAAAMRQRGVRAGERVVLLLPVGVDAFVVTLAALSIGAVVSSAAPEFGVPAVVDRFGQLDPVLFVGATSYVWGGRRYDRTEALVEIVRALPTVSSVLLVPGPDDPASPVDPDVLDVTRFAALAVAGSTRLLRVDGLSRAVAAHAGAAPRYERLPFDHPAYVLFSSGTTGRPKCLVHRAGGVLLKHLVEQRLHCDLGPGDRMLFFTTTGWMMWNWAVSAPATGATLVLHDGAPNHPDLLGLFRVATDLRLTHLGLSARLLDTMRTHELDPASVGPLDDLRVVMVTGSPLTVPTAEWLATALGPRVMLDPISGGTDLVGCFVGGDPTRPFHAGAMTGPVLGMDVDVVDDECRRRPPGEVGELVCRNAFPTVPLGIWGDEGGERLHATYFSRWPGVWAHGDLASWSAEGGVSIHGRSDATLNAGGVRIGTGELYTALEHVPDVADALAFGQSWDGDTRVVLLVVPREGAVFDDALVDTVRRTIRERCSPRHVPAVVLGVADLPRTLTGKLAEIAVSDAVNGRPVRNRDALANPEALDAVVAAVAALGG